jgi:hypothetical protein
MQEQILYILAFRDEPLVKVGLAANIHFRSRALGSGRFDFKESYLVRSKNKPCIRTLERNLKTFFAPHQVSSAKPMLNGNTETFDSSILPKMLRSIDTFSNIFPHAEFQVEHDISALIPGPRIPKPRPPHSAVPSDEYESLLNELRLGVSHEAEMLELARRLDVSPTLVTFWLRGERLLESVNFRGQAGHAASSSAS